MFLCSAFTLKWFDLWSQTTPDLRPQPHRLTFSIYILLYMKFMFVFMRITGCFICLCLQYKASCLISLINFKVNKCIRISFTFATNLLHAFHYCSTYLWKKKQIKYLKCGAEPVQSFYKTICEESESLIKSKNCCPSVVFLLWWRRRLMLVSSQSIHKLTCTHILR